jgi:hypothetical protein
MPFQSTDVDQVNLDTLPVHCRFGYNGYPEPNISGYPNFHLFTQVSTTSGFVAKTQTFKMVSRDLGLTEMCLQSGQLEMMRWESHLSY